MYKQNRKWLWQFDFYFGYQSTYYSARRKYLNIFCYTFTRETISEISSWKHREKTLTPRLHGSGSARSRYEFEYFQDERGSYIDNLVTLGKSQASQQIV